MEHTGTQVLEKESTSTSTGSGIKSPKWGFFPLTDGPEVSRALSLMWDDIEGLEGFMDNMDTLYTNIVKRRCQLWQLIVDMEPAAYAITNVSIYDKGRVFEVVLLSGRKLNEWLHIIEGALTYHGRETFKCRYISFDGRLGWAKILKEYNWKTLSIRMTKEL